jgi:hypothetical protein
MKLSSMQIRLGPIYWEDGYKIEKARYLIGQGIQRTLSSYVTHQPRRAGRIHPLPGIVISR